MLSFRLQQLQWLGGLAVALCCVVLGGMSFVASLDDYRRVKVGIENFERFRKVLLAVSAVSAERGPANLSMTVAPGDRNAVDWLRAARATSDQSIEAAISSMKDHDERRFRDVIVALTLLRSRLAEARSAIDAVAATDPAQRSADVFTAAILAMFSAADAAEVARARLIRRVIGRTPEIGAEVLLGVAASGLREHAGRFGSYIVMQLVPNPANREMAFEQMFRTAGRLAAIRRSIEALTSSIDADAPVQAAMTRLNERYFNDTMPRATAVARSARAGHPISVEAFTRLYVGDLRLADELRDVIAAASVGKLDHLRLHSLTRLLMSGALTALVCVILLAVTLVFRRALFHPLSTARDQVMAIASGDLSDPKQAGRVGPEIGEMLAELDALRDEQRFRKGLEDDRRRVAEELRLLAQTDVLTGLLNRRALEAEARHILAAADMSGGAIGLVMFDIDHFKRINDTYGHGVGDVVLKRIAHELSPLVRAGGILARYGGEEFLLLQPNATRREVEVTTAHLRETIERASFPEAPQLRATASFGIALRGTGAVTTWETLVAMADRRLYAAKRAGRNRICSEDNSSGWTSIAA